MSIDLLRLQSIENDIIFYPIIILTRRTRNCTETVWTQFLVISCPQTSVIQNKTCRKNFTANVANLAMKL